MVSEAFIDAGGVRLQLLPQRAAFLPDCATLLVADAHIGKAASFRKLGVPVPAGTTSETLGRLSHCIAQRCASRVIFLGDFLHSAHARAPATLAALARWRAQHAHLELTLVRGNHDDHAGDPPASLDMRCVNEPLLLNGLALCHHPQTVPGAYVLAGHLHPGVVLGARGFERMRLPCFHFGATGGVLPAFGAFTGLHVVRPAAGERTFVVAADTVREVLARPGPDKGPSRA
ncbi:MAG: ligase-associated DNA damage response endonuclease PdeM [Rubrivivax sp.]